MKKVSVIIPTYNRTDFLKMTLDSVINQTYKSIEIIVVDDGSPNNVTEELCKQYKNVDYFKIKNSGGPATPRNYGFKKSTGDYIAFLDDDDLWLQTKIEEQVEVLDQNPEFGIVHCYCDTIDKNGKLTGKSIGQPGTPDIKHGDVSKKMIGNWTLMMPTPLLRRALVYNVGLFNTIMPPAGEDVEFWTRCSFFTKFYYVDKPLALYRVHDRNISNSNGNYVDLPIYLKEIIDLSIIYKKLTNSEYDAMLLNICISQAKHVKINFLKTLLNLNKINPFWFFNFRIFKVLIKKILK